MDEPKNEEAVQCSLTQYDTVQCPSHSPRKKNKILAKGTMTSQAAKKISPFSDIFLTERVLDHARCVLSSSITDVSLAVMGFVLFPSEVCGRSYCMCLTFAFCFSSAASLAASKSSSFLPGRRTDNHLSVVGLSSLVFVVDVGGRRSKRWMDRTSNSMGATTKQRTAA